MGWRHSHVRNLYRHILYIVDHEPVILSVRHFILSACFRQSVRVYHSSHSTLSLVHQPSVFDPSILDLWNPPLHLAIDNFASRTVRQYVRYTENVLPGKRGTTWAAQDQVRLRCRRKIPIIPEKLEWTSELTYRATQSSKAGNLSDTRTQCVCDKHSVSVSSTSAKEFGQFLLCLNRRARCLSRTNWCFARQPGEKISTQIPQRLKGMYWLKLLSLMFYACICALRSFQLGSPRMQPSSRYDGCALRAIDLGAVVALQPRLALSSM